MKRNKKVSYKKTQQKYTQKKNKQKRKAPVIKEQVVFKKNYFNIWLAIGLMIFIGLVSFFNYLSADFLFYFKDIGSDTLNQNYPAVVHRFNILLEDTKASWSFYEGMGHTFSNTMVTNPYGLFVRFINYIGTSIFGINYFIYGSFTRSFIFHFLLSGILFYFYQRTLSVNKFSSIIGALLITFSGYMVVGSSWSFSGYIFLIIFLLFAFEQLYVKNRWYFFPFAVLFLSSNLFLLFIYTLFLTLYFLFRFLSTKGESIKSFLLITGKMVGLGIVGIIMNTSTAYHYFLKIFFSPRVSGNASYSKTLSGGEELIEQSNLGATTLLRFFSSDIIGTGSEFAGWQNYFEAPLFYIGLLTLLIFPQVFIHLNKRRKIIFGSFLGFWILTLLFPYLRHAFLAFTGDYFRYGFDFFIPFTLLFYSIYALNELDKNFKLNLPLLAGTFVLLLVVLFFPYDSIPISAIDNNLRKIIVLLLILYSGLIFLMSKPQYKSFAQIGLILLLVVELSYFSYNYYDDRVPVTKAEFEQNAGGYKDGTIEAVNYIKSIDKSKFYRTEKDYQSGNAIHGSLNDAQAQGYYGTTSYSSFNQLNYVHFLEEMELIQKGDETATRWLTGFRGKPLLQTFGNIKYHLSKSERPEFMRVGFDSLSSKAGVTILKNRFYLPFGYTYDKYINFDDFKELIKYRVTQHSLNNIKQEFTIVGQPKLGENVAKNMTAILNKEFDKKEDLLAETEMLIGKEITNKFKFKIIKHCVNTFQEELLLLNGFVYNKEDILNVNNLEQIALGDTNIFIDDRLFNFKIYETFVKELRKDTLQIKKFTNSRITASIELPKTKMLFLTIPYDNGWKIKVNGKNEELSRVNIGFTGIVLQKGKHELEIYYVNQYSQLITYISIISIILFWLFLCFDIYRKRKTKKMISNG